MIKTEEEVGDRQSGVNAGHFSPADEVEVCNLRRYVMTYINTVIEANDEKLEAQQKYLQTL
jgi:hypothetical protein